MSKFLLTTHQTPTDQIVSAEDLEFLKRSTDGLTAVSDPASQCPSDNYTLVADQDNSGSWSTSWMLKTEYTNIQKNRSLAIQMRIKRNLLLAATDWTQANDIPAETSNKWVDYRQSLRDITSQEGFPTDISWPAKP